MAKNVFISFRFSDGKSYKDKLSQLLDMRYDTVDFSEDEDRSRMSEYTIRDYLYRKLRRSSVTIIIVTPQAINHKKNWRGDYDDWMYDEIRYSLENREGNKTNGLIAVYTPEAASLLVEKSSSGSTIVHNIDNLFRRNMMNVKQAYKRNPEPDIYDRDYDSYCSLIPWNEFVNDIGHFIDIAVGKRDCQYKYDIKKR